MLALLSSLGSAPALSGQSKQSPYPTAPMAPELNGPVGWLNTNRPITLKQLRGKIVILDFWTYCCINCMHVIPELRALEEKYNKDLVVIGIHSAKFTNEKDTDHIRNAIMRYDIRHPVANDANLTLWHSYGITAWPTLVVISPDGKIVRSVSGEGTYPMLDRVIAGLIIEYGKLGQLNTKPLPVSLERAKQPTRALNFPGKMAIDEANKLLFISDSGHNRIVVTDLDGKIRYVIGSGQEGRVDGTYSQAKFHNPEGIALHAGSLWIADTDNNAIRKVDLAAKQVTTVGGNGYSRRYPMSYTGDPAKTMFNSPWDLVFAGDKLFIAMAGAQQIWWLDPGQQKTGIYAGLGFEGLTNGKLNLSNFAQPSGITTDGKSLFVADSEASAVRKLPIASSPDAKVETLIGHDLFKFGDKDGNYDAALLQHPLAITFANGTLYIADSYNHKIKILDPDHKVITTFLGTGKAGSSDGPQVEFSEPAGLAATGSALYVCDTNNHAVRVIDLKTKKVKTLSVH